MRRVVCKMMKPARINSVEPYDWTKLLREGQSEGHHMVSRLLTDFRSGTNRFDAPGEALLACLAGNGVVAVAGLNREPDESLVRAGRIRRLYVLPESRGHGLGRRLVEAITSLAQPHFAVLTVNVGRPNAQGFYGHLGFTRVVHPSITHRRDLARNPSAVSVSGTLGS